MFLISLATPEVEVVSNIGITYPLKLILHTEYHIQDITTQVIDNKAITTISMFFLLAFNSRVDGDDVLVCVRG